MKTDHAARILAHQEYKRALPPLSAVLEHYGVLASLRQTGMQLCGPCPIHGGTNRKQFVVNPATNEWKCFSPAHDKGGSTLEFVMAMQNCDFQEATAHIARWFAMPSVTKSSQSKQRSRTMSGGRPSHKAYCVEDKENDQPKEDQSKAFWTRIGSAWPHGDGKGLNIVLSALPVGNRIVLREYTADDEEEDKKNAKRKR